MKRLAITLFFILVIVITTSIIIFNRMKQDLIQANQPKKASKTGLPSQPVLKRGVGLEDLKRPEGVIHDASPLPKSEGKQEPKETEYNLEEIPHREIEKTGTEAEPPEEDVSSEKRLNTQPAINELEELKASGAVIY